MLFDQVCAINNVRDKAQIRKAVYQAVKRMIVNSLIRKVLEKFKRDMLMKNGWRISSEISRLFKGEFDSGTYWIVDRLIIFGSKVTRETVEFGPILSVNEKKIVNNLGENCWKKERILQWKLHTKKTNIKWRYND